VLNAIHVLTKQDEEGKWYWEYNNYLGHHKLYHYAWRKKIRVLTALAIGQPASECIIVTQCRDREDMEKAYGKVEEVSGVFVKNFFSQAKTMPAQGFGGMDENDPQ
jgi:hypothetical protein